jgi:hypothetical protein
MLTFMMNIIGMSTHPTIRPESPTSTFTVTRGCVMLIRTIPTFTTGIRTADRHRPYRSDRPVYHLPGQTLLGWRKC